MLKGTPLRFVFDTTTLSCCFPNLQFGELKLQIGDPEASSPREDAQEFHMKGEN